MCESLYVNVRMCVFPQEQCGSYTFIPYVVLPQGKVFACDATLLNGIKELMQPSFRLEPLLTPLVERLIQLLDNVHVHARSACHATPAACLIIPL